MRWVGLSSPAWRHLALADDLQLIIGPTGVHLVRTLGGRDLTRASHALGFLAEAAQQLHEVIPPRHRHTVTAAVCLLGETSESHGQVLGGMLCADRDTVTHAIRHSPVVLSAGEVAHLATTLTAALTRSPATRTGRRHGPGWRSWWRRAA